MIYIYLEDNLEQYSEAKIEQLMETLPEQRRTFAQRFKFPQGRKESVLAYLLLCRGLKEQYDIHTMPDFIMGEHGKPTLKDYPQIHFNLSHCKQAVLCVLGDGPVGADVERLGRYHEDVARYCMSDEEMAVIGQDNRPEFPFTRLWTKKEAVLKLQGTGITDQMKTVLTHLEGIELMTYEVPEKGYIYSVAHFCEPFQQANETNF